MRFSTFVIMFALVLWSNAYSGQLSGAANTSSEGTRHIVSVSGFYIGDPADYEYVFLRRQAIGVCEPDEYLHDNSIPFELEPWNGPGLAFSGTVEFEAPDPRVVYRYQPYAMSSDGTERIILNWCATDYRSYDLVSCQEAPFLRGRLELDFFHDSLGFRIVPCDENCWSEQLYFCYPTLDRLVELGGENAIDLIGEVVDVYGDLIRCQLLGADSHEVTRIERAPLGSCGPVPVESSSWGGIKVMYR